MVFEGTGESVCTEGDVTMKNGKPDGLLKFYYNTGEIAIEQEFSEGVPDGYGQAFYKNSVLRSKGYLDMNIRVGIHKDYYPSGKIKEYRYFENDTAIYIKIYDDAGRIIKSLLPLNVSQEKEESNLSQINIRLEHSMLDTPYLVSFISPSGMVDAFEDTVYSKGFELEYTWNKRKYGSSRIYGYVIEADSTFTSIGETQFYFPE